MGLIILILGGIAICAFFAFVSGPQRAKVQRYVLVVLSFLALWVFILTIGVIKPTLYTIEARTEYVEYVNTETEGRLNFSNVKFRDNFTSFTDSVYGRASLIPGVKVKIYRTGKGPLRIHVSPPKGGKKYLGVLKHDSGKVDSLFTDASFELKSPEKALAAGKSHLIYFEGRDVQVGKTVAKLPSSNSAPILQEATLTASQRVFIGTQRYESMRYQLGFGETLSFNTALRDGKGKSGVGFAVFDEGIGVRFVYNIDAKNAEVHKAGFGESDDYLVVKPTLLNRLTSDSFLQTISFLFAGLIVITTLWTFYYDTKAHHEIKD